MKKFMIVILLVLGFSFLYTANADTVQSTDLIARLPNGQTVVVQLDACYDPVTKRWGPCYVQTSVTCKVENTK